MSQESQGLLSPFLKKMRYLNAVTYISNNCVMLDIGCGSGEFHQFLPAGVKYFGIDAKKYWNDQAKNLYVAKIGKRYPKQITARKYDVITALAVIEHLKDPERLFIDAKKLLKRNGKLILTTPHPVGKFFHEFGATLGLFSRDASEEHEQFFKKSNLDHFGQSNGFALHKYNRFLFGLNQIAFFQ